MLSDACGRCRHQGWADWRCPEPVSRVAQFQSGRSHDRPRARAWVASVKQVLVSGSSEADHQPCVTGKRGVSRHPLSLRDSATFTQRPTNPVTTSRPRSGSPCGMDIRSCGPGHLPGPEACLARRLRPLLRTRAPRPANLRPSVCLLVLCLCIGMPCYIQYLWLCRDARGTVHATTALKSLHQDKHSRRYRAADLVHALTRSRWAAGGRHRPT